MQAKQNYVSPESEVIEIQLEGVIAASGKPKYYKPFGDEVEWN